MRIDAYHGTRVDKAKVEEAAWKRAARGDITIIHRHAHGSTCIGEEHEEVGPQQLKEREEAQAKKG